MGSLDPSEGISSASPRTKRAWQLFWAWAGGVPLRQKIFGIVVASLLFLGLAIGLWVRSGLGDWLSYLLSEERVGQAMAAGTRGVFIITILAALIGLFFAWVLTWILTRPILDITQVAEQVTQGNLAVQAPVWADDEIGQLGTAFNAMIESMARSRSEIKSTNETLRRQNRELAALYKLSGMACQAVDLNRVLEDGLQDVLEITGADMGKIALLDSSGEDLKLMASRNIPEALRDHKGFLDRQHPFFQRVARTGETLFVPDIQQADEAIRFPAWETYHAFISVPIKVQGQVQGVMNILSRSAAQIGEHDVRFMETVCSALSVAVENSRLWQEVIRKEASRTRLLAKVVTAQEEERQRISRELHDETGQALTSLLVQLKILEGQSDLESVRAQIGTLRALTAQTLEDIHRLSLDLRPAALDDLGLVAALQWLIDERAGKNGLTIHLQDDDLESVRLPHEIENVLYRIIQEALTNIIRHAQAEHAWVELTRDGEIVRIAIRDDGVGFDPQEAAERPEGGVGLLGMRERIELIGGTFRLQSAPGAGTRIEAAVRLSPESKTG